MSQQTVHAGDSIREKILSVHGLRIPNGPPVLGKEGLPDEVRFIKSSRMKADLACSDDNYGNAIKFLSHPAQQTLYHEPTRLKKSTSGKGNLVAIKD
jgi:hypothetical protein